MPRKNRDLIYELSVGIDEENEDKELSEIRYLDTKYFVLMRVLLLLLSLAFCFPMYNYLQTQISSAIGIYGIMPRIITLIHLLCITVSIQSACTWKKYRFRRSVITAYNKSFVILAILSMVNHMSFALIPGLNYFIMRYSFGTGYLAVLKIWGASWDTIVKISLSFLLCAILGALYMFVMSVITLPLNMMYVSDRLSDTLYQ